MVVTICALRQAKRTFLERREWKILPWKNLSVRKPLMCFLQDIMVDIPGLYEDWASLNNITTDIGLTTATRSLLGSRICQHIVTLYEWRRRWEAVFHGACWEVSTCSMENLTIDENGHPLFLTVIEFESLMRANELRHYNASLILLLQLGNHVLGPGLEQTLPAYTPHIKLSIETVVPPLQAAGTPAHIEPALEILRTVEYSLQFLRTDAAGFYLLFPLQITLYALDSWKGYTAERARSWLHRVVSMISTRGGFTMGEKGQDYDVAVCLRKRCGLPKSEEGKSEEGVRG